MKIPGNKPLYAIMEWNGVKYAAHIRVFNLRGLEIFGTVTLISKREYQELRKNGMPSWGEKELMLSKMYR